MRTLLTLALVGFLLFIGFTVKLGERTFFGHLQAIWSTHEAQDMRKGVEEKAGPALDRVKRGVEAGIKAAAGDDAEPVTQDAGPDAPVDALVTPERP